MRKVAITEFKDVVLYDERHTIASRTAFSGRLDGRSFFVERPFNHQVITRLTGFKVKKEAYCYNTDDGTSFQASLSSPLATRNQRKHDEKKCNNAVEGSAADRTSPEKSIANKEINMKKEPAYNYETDHDGSSPSRPVVAPLSSEISVSSRMAAEGGSHAAGVQVKEEAYCCDIDDDVSSPASSSLVSRNHMKVDQDKCLEGKEGGCHRHQPTAKNAHRKRQRTQPARSGLAPQSNGRVGIAKEGIKVKEEPAYNYDTEDDESSTSHPVVTPPSPRIPASARMVDEGESRATPTLNMADDSAKKAIFDARARRRREGRRRCRNMLKQEVTWCASAQAIPKAADRRWIARSVANANHPLSAEQDDFLDRFCNKDEKKLATQGTYLDTAGILNFVESFPYVLLAHRKGGSNAIPGVEWDLKTLYENLKNSGQSGRGRWKHMVGISICKTKRIIYFYDPKKCWGAKGEHQQNESHILDGGKSTWMARKSTGCEWVKKVYDTVLELDTVNPASLKWSLLLVKVFVYQENAFDCGFFVAYFF